MSTAAEVVPDAPSTRLPRPNGRSGTGRSSGLNPLPVSLLLLVLSMLALLGCSRRYYRRQADLEAYHLVQEKANDPRWPLEGYTINVDPRSRMHDPFDPDQPPMPPDDPTSHELMHCVDNKKGYPKWHENGDTPFVENPCWLNYLPANEQGEIVLDADSAVSVALMHSPDYQERLEELYLSALDVSFERFRFDHQFFSRHNLVYTADGRERSADGKSQSTLELSTLPFRRGTRVEKLYATGAELIVGLGNSIVWQFSGPDTNAVNTVLDFTLIQPLLRGAGRARVLERLTIAERSLLANVRQMERFRRGFYVELVTGRDSGPGPSRRGGFFGGSGLEGFTGVGGGGFGRVGGFSGGAFGGGAGAGEAGGFFGLLQNQQGIRNQQSTIAALRNSLAQLESFYRADRIDYLQVQQARQALFEAQSQLLNSSTAFQNSLDRFKGDLGLPPQMPVVIDESFVETFNLIDTAMVPVQDELTDLQQTVGNTIIRLLPNGNRGAAFDAQAVPLTWNDTLAAELVRLRQQVARAERIRGDIVRVNLPRARQDIERLKQSLPQRRRDLLLVRQRLGALRASQREAAASKGKAAEEEGDDVGFADIGELEQLPDKLQVMLAELSQQFEAAADVLTEFDRKVQVLLGEGARLEPGVLQQRLQDEVVAPIPNELTELSAELLELLLIQARARTESITLVPVRLDWSDALEIARANRRDWMNARAALVDSWRLIQFNANDLESGLDVVFSGEIENEGDNPVKLSSSTGQLRVGLEFDAPLTRLAERNTYRQALIEYQQARRSYYEFQDAITRGLRDSIRTIELNQLNFELRRAAVQVAIAQVELARLRLQEPPKPEQEAVFGPTTARDLVQALSSLLSTQNDFLSVWINYEVLRRTLDFDLGTMQLDQEGLWVDPGPIGSSSATEDPDADQPEELPPGNLVGRSGGISTETPPELRGASSSPDRQLVATNVDALCRLPSIAIGPTEGQAEGTASESADQRAVLQRLPPIHRGSDRSQATD